MSMISKSALQRHKLCLKLIKLLSLFFLGLFVFHHCLELLELICLLCESGFFLIVNLSLECNHVLFNLVILCSVFFSALDSLFHFSFEFNYL